MAKDNLLIGLYKSINLLIDLINYIMYLLIKSLIQDTIVFNNYIYIHASLICSVFLFNKKNVKMKKLKFCDITLKSLLLELSSNI